MTTKKITKKEVQTTRKIVAQMRAEQARAWEEATRLNLAADEREGEYYAMFQKYRAQEGL